MMRTSFFDIDENVHRYTTSALFQAAQNPLSSALYHEMLLKEGTRFPATRIMGSCVALQRHEAQHICLLPSLDCWPVDARYMTCITASICGDEMVASPH